MILYAALFYGIAKGLPEKLTGMLPTLAGHGVGAVLWSPFVSTDNPYSMGYDPRCDLRLGQWWGSDAEILATCNAIHEHGMLVLQDWVCRQYGVTTLPILEPDPKLFPKTAEDFVPAEPYDVTFEAKNGANDGMVVSYTHTSGYMLKGKQQAGQWQERVLGIDGFRLDEAKGLAVSVTKALNAARPGWNFAEVYEGNPYMLAEFVRVTGMAVLDFPAFYAYLAVSRGAPLTTLINNGFYAQDSAHSVIFVGSFDMSGPNAIISNKLWFYLHALTVGSHGVVLFAEDYERFGLAKWMLNMAWFSTAVATGKLTYRIEEPGFLAWQRDGDGGPGMWSGGCLCAISSDPVQWQTRRVQTHFAPGTVLHNFAPTLGHATTVDHEGCTWVTVSPNYYGDSLSFVMLADAGLQGYQIPIHPLSKRGTGEFTNFSGVTVTK